MIKNIIFDFGNVLLNLDIPKTTQQFKELLDLGTNDKEAMMAVNHLIEQLETDSISEDQFHQAVKNRSKQPISKEQIDAALNAMLLDFPLPRMEMLSTLRKTYQLYLLSNINSIHLRKVLDYLEKDHGISDFEHRFFTKTYFSHLIKLRKPNPEIYRYVLEDAGINPEESLFIDDLYHNTKTAEKFGIHTILHDPSDDITEVLQKSKFLNDH